MCFDDSPMTATVDNQSNKASAPEIEKRNAIIKSKTDGDGNAAHKKVYFSIFLHVDFFQINKYLPLNVDLQLRLTRHSKSFGILAPAKAAGTVPAIPEPNYISYIHKLQLTTRAMLTSKEYRSSLAIAMKNENNLSKFHYDDSKIRSFIIPQGVMDFVIPNLDTALLPKNIIVGFVSTQAFSGNYHQQPFLFYHYNLKSIYCSYNSTQIPTQSLKMNWEEGDDAVAYRHTLDNVGIGLSGTNIGFSREHFRKGKSLFCFDFSPNLNNGSQINDPKTGLINLYLQFGTPLPHTIQCICYYSYHGGIVMNSNEEILPVTI